MTRPEEVAFKLLQVRAFLAREQLSAIALAGQTNFSWLSAGGDHHVALASETGVGALVVTADRQYVVSDNIEADRLATEELAGLSFESVHFPWYRDELATTIRNLGGDRIGADGPWLPTATDVSGTLNRLRWQLLPPEIDRYRALGQDVSRVVCDCAKEIVPGMSEHEIAGLMVARLKSLAIAPNCILVAVDERLSLYRHPIPTDKKLGQIAMLVASVRRYGLGISVTRLVHFGPLSDELRRKHDACVLVDACLNLETRPGAAVSDVFAKAVATYEATGYGEQWTLHHQGGAAGYAAREYKATPDCAEVVLENQAFAWNPSIAGTKSEDTIITTTSGIEVLSPAEDWPMLEVEYAGQTMSRPDILVR